jgi:hypothetical protein
VNRRDFALTVNNERFKQRTLERSETCIGFIGKMKTCFKRALEAGFPDGASSSHGPTGAPDNGNRINYPEDFAGHG